MKSQRLLNIKEIISSNKIKGQDELLDALLKRGFTVTQATLSRDLKSLKVIKEPDADGNYFYALLSTALVENQSPHLAFDKVTVGFSGNLAVVRTRPGYATSIASEIDMYMKAQLLGSIAGDDTILLIPHELVKREEILNLLRQIINTVEEL